MSNICRVDCGFCPMMRSRQRNPDYIQTRATAEQIVGAAERAYQAGFRSLFIQSGEDPGIVPVVAEALRFIRREHEWSGVILNMGSLDLGQYLQLAEAGATGYLIKHETANPTLHEKCRNEPLVKRVQHMLLAREAGLEIGSGNILGLPGQTDVDLANDLIFLGRLGGETMVSCAPFTPSTLLVDGFRDHPPGDFQKTLRFIALLRLFFPKARIPATSNCDSAHIRGVQTQTLSGQARAINAGANGISVQFTPEPVEKHYQIYDGRENRHMVYLEKALRVSRETGLPLDLKPAMQAPSVQSA